MSQSIPSTPSSDASAGPAGAAVEKTASVEKKIAAALTTLWQRNLPVVRDRLALLDRAAALAEDGTLTPALARDAAITAHKLAGSLGMFGYTEGTRTACAIEQLLDVHRAPDPANLLRLTRELRATLSA